MGKVLQKDLGFWERMAPNYDRHVRWLGKSQEKVIHRLCDQVRTAQRILDVGTGTGNIALALAKVVPVVDAVDPSPLMLEVARSKAQAMNVQNVRFALQGAYDLDFPDKTFDAVILAPRTAHHRETRLGARRSWTGAEEWRPDHCAHLLPRPEFIGSYSFVSFQESDETTRVQ
jgi:SAM-dependent methyltransferase